MNLPKQTRPVSRQASTAPMSKSVTPSDCGCQIACIGACVLGKCLGYCI
jgi:hypothetical protein